MTTATPIDIGDRKQLFLDETFFAARDGVNLTVHSPVDRGIAIQADQPWESTAACNWCVVVHDPKLGHVKMYYEAYRALPRKSNGQPNFDRRMCCAISHDGVRWEKPDLGIYEFEGSRDNNIVFMGEEDAESADGIATSAGRRAYDQMGSVVIDEDDEPGRRYKMLFCGSECKMRAATSPDGFRWTVLNDWKPVSEQGADSGNIFFRDDSLGKWVGYFRMWDAMRRISRIETDDWTAWPKRSRENVILGPDELDAYDRYLDAPCFRPGEFIDNVIDGRRYDPDGPRERFVWCTDNVDQIDGIDFYNQPVTKYTHADRAYIMPFTAFCHRPNLMEIQLAISRDGIHWSRPGNRQAWIRPPVDEFVGVMYCGPGMVQDGPRLYHYHSCMPEWHGWGKPGQHEIVEPPRFSGSVRRVELRLDGYVSAAAENMEGGFVTPPFVFEGSRLELNVDTGASGRVDVELVRVHGDPVRGYRIPEFDRESCDTIVCNETRRIVTWNGNSDVSPLAGVPIRMHVRMRRANLYAFQFVKE